MPTQLQVEFSEFLAQLWEGDCDAAFPWIANNGCTTILSPSPSLASGPIRFWHSYAITHHRAWDTWKNGDFKGPSADVTYGALRKQSWWCCSLRQAAAHYSWTIHPRWTFDRLSRALRISMKSGSIPKTACCCLRIFKWGGVAKKKTDPSLIWVMRKFRARTLISDIHLATKLLQPRNRRTLHKYFHRHGDLLMNSAMTKVYAAADPNVIIYDGRVGAALGLLARLFLQGKYPAGPVPGDLAFLWGQTQRHTTPADDPRNPSFGAWKFRRLNQSHINDGHRAEAARIASKILTRTMHNLQGKGQNVTMRDLEKALFMIGYRVR